MSKDTTTTPISDQTVSAIDKAIAAAKSRKATKATAGTTEGTTSTATTPKEPKVAKPKVTDEDKAAKLALRETERASKKADRDVARTAKIAERNAGRAPAHLKKVNKAAEKLSPLAQAAELLFNEATANLPAADLAALATHIQHFNRLNATTRAVSMKLEAGMVVKIVGGDPRYIGQVGTVFKAQRIRAYITLEGVTKPIYCFTSDCEPVEAEASAAASA